MQRIQRSMVMGMFECVSGCKATWLCSWSVICRRPVRHIGSACPCLGRLPSRTACRHLRLYGHKRWSATLPSCCIHLQEDGLVNCSGTNKDGCDVLYFELQRRPETSIALLKRSDAPIACSSKCVLLFTCVFSLFVLHLASRSAAVAR